MSFGTRANGHNQAENEKVCNPYRIKSAGVAAGEETKGGGRVSGELVMLLRKCLCDIRTGDIWTYKVLRGAGALASCISFINEKIFS